MTDNQVTLHGHPIKVGDTVYHINFGKGTVISINHMRKSQIEVKFKHTISEYTLDGIYCQSDVLPRIYWQPIDEKALEAAKIPPPEPVYEYQWLVKTNSINKIGIHNLWQFDTTSYHKTEEEALADYKTFYPDAELVSCIEESKRLVK
jgi:hypothetical protein